jgi:hypothetical protein
MAIDVETMWVADEEQLQATVRTLVLQGGQVQARTPGEIQLLLEKQISVPVLVGGLVLCLVPGLVYLIWYLAADRSEHITVKVGTPPTVRTHHQLWPDGADEPAPTPPPEVEPTDRRNWGARPTEPMPMAYPPDPGLYPVVESPPPPPPPPV